MDTDILDGKQYHIHKGDCVEHMATLPPACFDMAVFSPPFPSVFAYTSQPCDLGNSEDLTGEAKLHLSFFYNQLVRIIKPGRVVMVHVTQIPALARNNIQGLYNYRDLNIRLAQRAGFTYDNEWSVGKNPQSQAIRTHSHRLLFVTHERDRIKSGPALIDYLLKFIAPGENAVPVVEGGPSRQEWIDWAEGHWHWRDVRETDTLNVKAGRGEEDTKHICPLQLPVIHRLVKMFTNPGEIVFSPFGGIGSEGYQSVKLGRRAYCCEIKPEYIKANEENMKRASAVDGSMGLLELFDDAEQAAKVDQSADMTAGV